MTESTRAADDATGEDVPSSGIEVETHVPFGMTGSFPLRLADLFFADDGLYIAEYSYITPFVGLTAGKHRREASAMREIYDRYGLDAVLVTANTVVWHSYRNIERVTVHEGGRVGRPKLAVYPEVGPSQAYRFHRRPAFEEGVADVDAVAERHGFPVEHERGLGFTPRESLRRFFWKP
ncbi:MAG: hypothetical protein ABEJ61_09880 [Haloferacaceae archaeon]